METLKAFTGKNFMRNALALLVVLIGFLLIFSILFFKPEGLNRDIANLCLGFDFGAMTQIFQYYFGTSQSSTDKNEIISKKP